MMAAIRTTSHQNRTLCLVKCFAVIPCWSNCTKWAECPFTWLTQMFLKRSKEWKIFCCLIAMLSEHEMWKFQGAGWDYSILVTLHKIGKVSFHLHQWYEYFLCRLALLPKPKIWEFQGVICHFHPKISLKSERHM